MKRDGLAVTHPDFGAAIPCPDCEGARKARNPRAEYAYFLERERATWGDTYVGGPGPLAPHVERIRERLGVEAEEGATP